MADRRVEKTKQSICDSLITLLEKKELSQITVTEVSRLANVGRGTFYLHYEDIYKCYHCIEEDIFTEITGIFEGAFPTTQKDNIIKFAGNLVKYIYAHKRVLSVFFRLDDTEKTITKLKVLFNKLAFQETVAVQGAKNCDITYATVEAFFMISGTVGVLEGWLTEGFVSSKEQIAGYIFKILMKMNGIDFTEDEQNQFINLEGFYGGCKEKR